MENTLSFTLHAKKGILFVNRYFILLHSILAFIALIYVRAFSIEIIIEQELQVLCFEVHY